MSSGGAVLRLILGDQLSRGVSALEDLDPGRDVVVMGEVADETVYVKHHPKKIALIFSAMRHFAADLERGGAKVDYQTLDKPNAAQDFTALLARAVKTYAPARIVLTAPSEWRVMELAKGWEAELGLPVEIREDSRFFCSLDDFADWAEGRKELRMETFYRWQRRRSGILMDGDDPSGGQWNFDKDNRKTLPKDLETPHRRGFRPDGITEEVLELVGRRFSGHFGDLEPFELAVTAEQAEEAAAFFMEHLLPSFGDYQDAMKAGEDLLFHSYLAQYLNIGLLDPRALCAQAEKAYRQGRAPLNAVEGFIRQILGWREYVRGLYWLKMPGYAELNALGASRPLPEFYWSGETEMNCIAETVDQTRRLAYAHHIQRLMVTGNFALLAGIDPAAVNEWYLLVYADAFEWVQLPNTHGMALYADGGILGSKPYAASGKYIDRMSDYCGSCRYNVKASEGEGACPFNYLYWDFIARNAKHFEGNRRMAMPLSTLKKMDAEKVASMRRQAKAFLETLKSDKEAA